MAQQNKLRFIAAIALAISVVNVPVIAGDFEGISSYIDSSESIRKIRYLTPGERGDLPTASQPQQPVKINTRLLADIIWVDRNHEYAIADNAAISPDGGDISAGWWLNNSRTAEYRTIGGASPVWRYYMDENRAIRIDNSGAHTAISNGRDQPFRYWDVGSPLPLREFPIGVNWGSRDVSYSNDGTLLACVEDSLQVVGSFWVFDTVAEDTVFAERFVPDGGVYGVDLSGDGSAAAVSCYYKIYIYDVELGVIRDSVENFSQNTAELSADGSKLVMGDFIGWFRVYEWDGSEYINTYEYDTGFDWVVGLAISDDGTTAMCGTFDFTPYSGMALMFDLTSNSIYWRYDQFGDVVNDCALSADGSIGVVCCWGKLEGTYGDVLTIFNRESSNPIFRLLDDIDEQGSIMSVDISADGRYVTAGGKAVHARVLGFGGMVYGIKVAEQHPHDVAVLSITSPWEFITPGQPVLLQSRFINIGKHTETFDVRCVITDLFTDEVLYNQTATVTDLPSLQYQTVTFEPYWTPPMGDGRYDIRFISELEGDMDEGNDEMNIVARSWRDILVTDIIFPTDSISFGSETIPFATFKNMGSYFDDFQATCRVENFLGFDVYNETITISDLNPYSEMDVEFPAWVPDDTGSYTIYFSADIEGDYNPEDNQMSMEFRAVRQLFYEDGSAEYQYWAGERDNDMFSVRFTPNLDPPYIIDKGWVYAGWDPYDYFWDYIAIWGDGNGKPNPIDVITRYDDPESVPPGSWLEVDFDDPVITEPGDFWMIVHWPDGFYRIIGAKVGADAEPPWNYRSWWYDVETNGWDRMLYKWLMRVQLEEAPTDIEEELPDEAPTSFELMQNYPNPFNPVTEISYSLPQSSHVEISIYNIYGQRIKTLVNSDQPTGSYEIIWDGKDSAGREVSSGIYFYRMQTDSFQETRRMTLLK